MDDLSLTKKLQSTLEYKKVCNMLETAKIIDLDNIQSEIETLHSGRKMRNMTLRRTSVNRLISASYQEAATRSRLVELVVTITRNYNMLELAYQAATESLISKFYKELPGSTKASKSAFVNDVMSELKIRLTEFKSVIEIANLIIADIDKCGFSLKHVVDLLQISNKRENIL